MPANSRFEPSTDAIDFEADTDADFVVGSAAPHAQNLVLRQYSVHTSAAALRSAEQRLKEIQQRYRAKAGSKIEDRPANV